MPLSDVLHQPIAQDRLQRALRSGRVPHAYLFTGPEGVGKEMLAARLAAVLLCNDPQSSIVTPQSSIPRQDACGQCVDCTLHAAGNHPDYHRIYRTLNKLHPNQKVRDRKAIDLSVDVIRHFLIDKVGLRPSRGRAKVFIIAEAHRLSSGAQNAMLKTLEEPPGHSYLILLAPSADTLLATTRSRSHQIAFQHLPARFIIEQLHARYDITAGFARFIAELSQGSPGIANKYAEIGLQDHLSIVLQALQTASHDPLNCGRTLLDASKQLTSAFKEQDDESKDTNASRQAQTVILSMVAAVLRDVQRITVGQRPVVFLDDPAVAAFAGTTTPQAVGCVIRAMAAAERQISRNANTSLVFDTVGIELGRGLSTVPQTVP